MASLASHILQSYESPQSHHQSSNVQSHNSAYDPSVHGSIQSTSAAPAPFSSGAFRPRIGQDTAMRIAELQAKLNKQLGPEYISQRPGPGGGPKLTYAEGWKVINLANEVFGFDGWASSITNLTVDFVDLNEQSQRYCVGVTAIVRVTLRDGVFHEDIGYGGVENLKSKGAALDKCKKEAVTDGIKRALRNFGNLLGNCLYDKSYTAEVTKIKVPPAKFDKSALHRRPEFAIPVPVSINTTPAQASESNVKTPLVIKPLPQFAPPQQRANAASGPSKPGVPVSHANGLNTPIQTPQQVQKPPAQPPAMRPPPLFPTTAAAMARTTIQEKRPGCAPVDNDESLLIHAPQALVTKTVPEDDDPDYGAHFFGSDDEALLAEMDFNAESYTNPSSGSPPGQDANEQSESTEGNSMEASPLALARLNHTAEVPVPRSILKPTSIESNLTAASHRPAPGNNANYSRGGSSKQATTAPTASAGGFRFPEDGSNVRRPNLFAPGVADGGEGNPIPGKKRSADSMTGAARGNGNSAGRAGLGLSAHQDASRRSSNGNESDGARSGREPLTSMDQGGNDTGLKRARR